MITSFAIVIFQKLHIRIYLLATETIAREEETITYLKAVPALMN